MNNFHMTKLKDKRCPICGNTKYMYHMSGRNVGSINVKCTNCNSYFRWDEISEQPELANNSPKHNNENDELISRQQAIDAIMDTEPLFGIDGTPYQKTQDVVNAINALPSIEPRKGRWIRTRTMVHDGELYCDQCEQEHPEQKLIWNYCPNCGADMREGEQ